MKNTTFYLIALLPFSLTARAQDVTPTPSPTPVTSASDEDANEREVQIIVTPTRTNRKISESASAVTVITPQQIEQKKPFALVDILRQAPGVSVVQNGAAGQLSSIFVRGAAPRHNLVLIDGIRINAPSFGATDFGAFPIENVQRIEVLRGPQSGVYGSDALGGVINIITRRGEGPLRTGGRFELGSNAINRQAVEAGGEIGRNRLSFSAQRLHSNGFRANEDYRNLGASFRLDRTLSTRSNLAFIGRLDDTKLGAIGSRFFPDPNERNNVRNLFGGLEWTNSSGRRSDKITFGLYDRAFRDIDPPNPGDFPTNTRLDEGSLSVNGQSSVATKNHLITAGVEYRRDRANASSSSGAYRRSLSTQAVYLQDEMRAGRFTIVPNLRFEDSSLFGGDINGRLALAYEVDKTAQIKGSVGTGYRIPTLDFLYFPGFSNPNLQPEKSTGYEIGYARQLPHNGRIELTVFRNTFRDLIDSPPPNFVPNNVANARVQGLELHLDQPFGNGFRAIINHAFLNNQASANQYLVRRPKFISTADLLFQRGKTQFDLGLIAAGRRFDVGSSGVAQFGGYTRFDLTVGYDVRPGVQVYARAQNLLNKRYEEVTGYPAPRLNFVVGLQTRAF